MKQAHIPAFWLLLAVLAACQLLNSCGGGGGNPPPASKLTLSGTVTSSGGAPIAGAAALLGLSQTSTDAQGRFSFANLSAGQYTVSVQDSAGNFTCRQVSLTEATTEFSFVLPASGAFELQQLLPLMGGAPAELDTSIVLDFNAALDADSVQGGDFLVSPDIGELELEVDGAQLRLRPRLQLAVSQTYVFELRGQIRSAGGAILPAPLRFVLRSAATDAASPQLLETQPAEGATDYATNRPVVFSFNEALDPESPLAVESTPPAELQASISGRNVTVRASGNWAVQTSYSIDVSGLRDLADNLRAGVDSLSFTTGTQAAPLNNIQPDWNRVTDSIVFASDTAGSYDIWAIDSDGSNLRQLSSDPGNESWPSLSSDGALLCWQARGAGGDFDIFVADVSDGDASDGHAVTGSLFNETQPVFSRTFSRSIFFVSDRTNPASLYSIDSGGGALTALDFNFGSGQADPSPHPLLDTQILFTSGRAGSNDIWRMIRSVIDSEVIDTNLTDDLLAQESQPDWLPDASGFVYISNRSGVNNLWLGDFSGGLERQVTNFELAASGPSVSPFSGESLCALSLANAEGGRDIVIIELVGGTIVSNLTGGGF